MACYGTISLTVTSPPQSFAEPITLAEAKAFLNLPERSPVDAAEDAMLAGFITAAREQAEMYQGRDLIRKQYDLLLDYFPYHNIELRRPLVSVDLIEYTDSDGVAHGMSLPDFILDSARGIVIPAYNQYWPTFTERPTSAVLIRHTAGYAPTDAFWSDAGARIKIGMLLLISHWYNGRLPFEAGIGAIGEYPFAVTALLSAGAELRVR